MGVRASRPPPGGALDGLAALRHPAARFLFQPRTWMRHYESLLDAIDLAYQAALEPSLWPNVLAATAESLQASRALILYAGSSSNSIVASQDDEPLTDSYFSEFKVINPIQQVLDRSWGQVRPPAYSDQDLVPRPDLVRSDFYAGFLRPADMCSILMLPLGNPCT